MNIKEAKNVSVHQLTNNTTRINVSIPDDIQMKIIFESEKFNSIYPEAKKRPVVLDGADAFDGPCSVVIDEDFIIVKLKALDKNKIIHLNNLVKTKFWRQVKVCWLLQYLNESEVAAWEEK